MAPIKICTEQVTVISENYSAGVSCTTPAHTPVVGAGSMCNMVVYNVGIDLNTTPPVLCFSYDTQLEYHYLDHGVTFSDFCDVFGSSTCVDLPDGINTCCDLSPTWSYTASCGSITTTPDSVSGDVSISFTVTNLCIPTIVCVDTTVCV